MLHVYFLKTPLSAAQLTPKLPARVLAIKPELACFPRFLLYTLSQTFKAFHSGATSTKKFEVEWLSRIACTPQHAQAIAFCAFKDTVGLVGTSPLSPAQLRQWGSPFAYRLTPSTKQNVAQSYGLTPAALNQFDLEDLLIEKSAVTFL